MAVSCECDQRVQKHMQGWEWHLRRSKDNESTCVWDLEFQVPGIGWQLEQRVHKPRDRLRAGWGSKSPEGVFTQDQETPEIRAAPVWADVFLCGMASTRGLLLPSTCENGWAEHLCDHMGRVGFLLAFCSMADEGLVAGAGVGDSVPLPLPPPPAGPQWEALLS